MEIFRGRYNCLQHVVFGWFLQETSRPMTEIAAAGARSELVSMAAPFAAFIVAWLVLTLFACK